MTQEKPNDKSNPFDFINSVREPSKDKKKDPFERAQTYQGVRAPDVTGKSSCASETVSKVDKNIAHDFEKTVEAKVDFDKTAAVKADFDKTLDANVSFDRTIQLGAADFDQTTEEKVDIVSQDIDFDKTIDDLNIHSLSANSSKVIGRYHAIQEIGSGGFGTVYKGYDPNLGREVAMKTIRYDKQIVEELDHFEKEARTLAQCNHPNIVQVYDVGRNEESPYIVMEFVNGPSICEYVKQQKISKDAKHVQKIICSHMLALVDALSYIHKRKIYHQDIKPKNILVSLNYNCAKLVDFGLAIENPHNEEQTISGTYAYMPPEKFEGKATPRMHDIYALGAVFFEILTGRAAHPGKSNTEIVQHVLNEDVCFLPEDNVDNKLKEICLKCLKNNPRERYQDVSQIYNDLMEYSGSATDVNEYPYLSLAVEDKKFIFPLTRNKNFIGRTFSNQVVIPDVTISRTQAMIELDEDKVIIQNLSEVNSIRVNDISLKYEQEVTLTGHEKIQIADYIFHYIPRSEISEYKEVVVDVEGDSVVGHVISAISDSQKEAENSGLSHSQIDNKMWEQTISVNDIEPKICEEEIKVIKAPSKRKNLEMNSSDVEKLQQSIKELKNTIESFEKKLGDVP